MGHELHLLLLHPTFDTLPIQERECVIDGVRVVHVAQMHVYGLPGKRRYFGTTELGRVAWHATQQLRREANALKPDILHICKPQPINGAAGWMAARQQGVPFYVDCDDYEAEANRVSSGAQRAVIRWFEDALPPRAAGVTVNTQFLRDRCLALGTHATRIVHVPNGADPIPSTGCAQTNFTPPTVLYLGTLSTVAHGVDILLHAFPIVLQRVPQARLLMVGDGDDRDTLRALADTLGIQHAVTWVGRVPSEETHRFFAQATCSVDPVRDSAAARGRSPLKIVESLAAGIPVVTGDVGDRREMLANGAAGVLVQANDAVALADGIVSLLTQPELRARLAQGAHRQREQYRWHALAARWITIYAPHL
jgi:glycosyltransferase involved in cell wall biosynthesis